MEEDWIAAIRADTALEALVGPALSWGKRAKGAGLPAVVFHLVSRPRAYDLSGATNLQENLVQADCWAETFLEAKAVARALEAAVANLTAPFTRGFIENERDDVEPVPAPGPRNATDIFRTSLDVRVWWQS